ncbi:MAG TPA: transaldolase [Rudaea sp.]
MTASKELHALGQSLWIDNISRGMLDDGTLARYIRDYDVTGLTSNPSIFEKAIVESSTYDADIRQSTADTSEALFFDLAIADLRRAAESFKPIHRATGGVDGWVSLEVSPLLADDAENTIAAAIELHRRAQRDNFFIKIPGTQAGTRAIENAIFAGVPVNVTLLFSRDQYLASAEAWMRGIERRIDAGLDPAIDSVASVFVSRWDVAANDKAPAELRNRLGIAIARHTYRAYLETMDSPRAQALVNAGARPQRLLWASTGTKDPSAPDTLYVEALAAPNTINTMPDKTLKAFAERGRVGKPMPADGGDAEAVIAEFNRVGIDTTALARRLQREGAQAFEKSWHALLQGIEKKTGKPKA